MKRILKLMQGKQSKGLFMWKRGDPSTRKILEGSIGGWGKETDDISA